VGYLKVIDNDQNMLPILDNIPFPSICPIYEIWTKYGTVPSQSMSMNNISINISNFQILGAILYFPTRMQRRNPDLDLPKLRSPRTLMFRGKYQASGKDLEEPLAGAPKRILNRLKRGRY